jgi:5-methylcytosine-specific restriction endonuclease McrA
MKRSGIKRGKPLERRSRLRPVSRKRRKELKQWDAVRAETRERDGDTCQAAHLVPQVPCYGPLEPHHIAKRSTSPAGIYDPENVVWICHQHHSWVSVNQLEANGVGLHRSSWEYKATG